MFHSIGIELANLSAVAVDQYGQFACKQSSQIAFVKRVPEQVSKCENRPAGLEEGRQMSPGLDSSRQTQCENCL